MAQNQKNPNRERTGSKSGEERERNEASRNEPGRNQELDRHATERTDRSSRGPSEAMEQPEGRESGERDRDDTTR